jgi:HPt (histidine-containing phosphotransfer) domain-containing protein
MRPELFGSELPKLPSPEAWQRLQQSLRRYDELYAGAREGLPVGELAATAHALKALAYSLGASSLSERCAGLERVHFTATLKGETLQVAREIATLTRQLLDATERHVVAL